MWKEVVNKLGINVKNNDDIIKFLPVITLINNNDFDHKVKILQFHKIPIRRLAQIKILTLAKEELERRITISKSNKFFVDVINEPLTLLDINRFSLKKYKPIVKKVIAMPSVVVEKEIVIKETTDVVSESSIKPLEIPKIPVVNEVLDIDPVVEVFEVVKDKPFVSIADAMLEKQLNSNNIPVDSKPLSSSEIEFSLVDDNDVFSNIIDMPLPKETPVVIPSEPEINPLDLIDTNIISDSSFDDMFDIINEVSMDLNSNSDITSILSNPVSGNLDVNNYSRYEYLSSMVVRIFALLDFDLNSRNSSIDNNLVKLILADKFSDNTILLNALTFNTDISRLEYDKLTNCIDDVLSSIQSNVRSL